MNEIEFNERAKIIEDRFSKLENEFRIVRSQQKKIERINKNLKRVNAYLKISCCLKIVLHIGTMKFRYEDYTMNRLLTHLQVYFFLNAYCLMKKNGYLTKRTIKTS